MHVLSEVHCYQDHRRWKSSETLSSLKVLATHFQQALSRYLGIAVSSDVVSFNFRKSLVSGHQMTCRSSQGLALSLGL